MSLGPEMVVAWGVEESGRTFGIVPTSRPREVRLPVQGHAAGQAERGSDPAHTWGFPSPDRCCFASGEISGRQSPGFYLFGVLHTNLKVPGVFGTEKKSIVRKRSCVKVRERPFLERLHEGGERGMSGSEGM